MPDYSLYKVDLDTVRPNPNDNTKTLRGDAPRTAFTKYNDLLTALKGSTTFVGNEEPSDPVAYMEWLDTSVNPPVKRIRYGNNSGWYVPSYNTTDTVKITGSVMTGALQSPTFYTFGAGAAQPRTKLGADNGEPVMELTRWSGQGINDLSWQLKNNNGSLEFNYSASGRDDSRTFINKGHIGSLTPINGQNGGFMFMDTLIGANAPLSSATTTTQAGWYKIGKAAYDLQGGDLKITIHGTTSYGANVNSSNGSVTTILARIDNDNKMRGSFHTETAGGAGSPTAVVFGTDGSIYILTGQFNNLSVYVQSHILVWIKQDPSYYGPFDNQPPGIPAVLGYGIRIGNPDNGNQLYVAFNDIISRCNIYANSLYPNADNTVNIGDPTRRYRDIFTSTGVVVTSDGTMKTQPRSFNSDELEAAIAIGELIGIYKWLYAIESKGDEAREHIGPTVQSVIEVLKAHNLDPFNYGFICHDRWEREVIEHPAILGSPEIPAFEGSPAVYDENNNLVKEEIPPRAGVPAIEGKEAWTEIIEAGERYAFRYDELLMFITRGYLEKQKRLEDRIKALESNS